MNDDFIPGVIIGFLFAILVGFFTVPSKTDVHKEVLMACSLDGKVTLNGREVVCFVGGGNAK